MDLVPGDTAQRVRSGAGLGKVRKPAKPLTEQRCRAVSFDGRTIGEKVFGHDHVSLLSETGSCHAGKREKIMLRRAEGFRSPDPVLRNAPAPADRSVNAGGGQDIMLRRIVRRHWLVRAS